MAPIVPERTGAFALVPEMIYKKGISMPSLHVEVRDDEIIVTQSGSKFRAVYHSVHHKPEGNQPQLIVKDMPHGNYDFLAQAWQSTRRANSVGLCKSADRSHRPGQRRAKDGKQV
jgi:hypothetical protein